MNILSGVSITCFAASYAVTLGLEISRLFFQIRVRWVVMIGFAGAGLVAHSAYLWSHTQHELETGIRTPLASWYDWCLLAAWVLVAAYLGLAIRRPHNTVGLFLLPFVFLLVAAAYAVRETPAFPRVQAINYWGMFHGIMLLLGTVAAALGFAAGIMYLMQSYRLKRKLPPRPGFRLPSLEWLQRFNRRCLLLSTCFIALGLIAGLALNIIRHASREGAIAWTDPVVLSSVVLFVWLAGATLFESLYKPAREGHKVAYITLASFVFLGLVLSLVLVGRHGTSQTRTDHGAARTRSDRVREMCVQRQNSFALNGAGQPPASLGRFTSRESQLAVSRTSRLEMLEDNRCSSASCKAGTQGEGGER